MRIPLLSLLIVAILALSPSTFAQEDDFPDPAPGLESAVGRAFLPAGRQSAPLTYLEVRVATFDTPEHASEAIDLWFDQLHHDTHSYLYDLSVLRPVGVEQVQDETRAMMGTSPLFDDAEVTSEASAVAVRDGSTLLTFLAWSRYTDGVDETLDIARRMLELEPLAFPPVPGVDYNEGPAWDPLPRIEHLPGGLTWHRDFLPCIGVLGASECPPPEATPAATPSE